MVQLGVPEGWARASAPVVVAVVDDAVDIDHPDLRSSIWVNPDEVPDNGIDDDGDGHVDDVHGWNFLDDDADVSLSSTDRSASDFEHATKIVGTLAAETNNAVGVAGCCPVCRVMVLKARDFASVRTGVPHFGAAVDYAIAHGARVLNFSDGARVRSASDDVVRDLEAAARRAEEAGLLIVAAAGNQGADVIWPARIPSVFAVAAVDWLGTPTSFTNFGPEISVAAPGVWVQTTMPDASYGYFGGTSASAPIVTALAAMLFSEHPDWTPDQVTARIRATARPANLTPRPEVVGLFGAGVVSFDDAL